MLRLPVELTRSRTGLHARRTSVIIVGGRGEPRVISEPSKPSRGTYSVGKSGYVELNLSPGEYAVLATLTMGPKGRVTGTFSVIDSNGVERLRVKYRRFKLRLSSGSPELSWAVDQAVSALGLSSYVRRSNYGRRPRGSGKPS